MPRGGTIKWNRSAFAEIRRLPTVDAMLHAEVDKIMEAVAGYPGDYQGGVERGRTRSRGYVVTRGYPAIRREWRDHTLLHAIGGSLAGRGVYTSKRGRKSVTTNEQAAKWGGNYEAFK